MFITLIESRLKSDTTAHFLAVEIIAPRTNERIRFPPSIVFTFDDYIIVKFMIQRPVNESLNESGGHICGETHRESFPDNGSFTIVVSRETTRR